MARVPVTQRLRQEIEGNIKELFKKRLQALTQAHLQHKELAYNTLVPPDDQAKLVAIPKEYLTRGRWFIASAEVSGYQFDFDPPRVMPTRYAQSYTQFKPAKETELYAALDAIDKQRASIEQECEALCKSVGKMLDACASLQNLVEVFPSALDYVSAATRDRYNLVEEKKKKLTKEERLAKIQAEMTAETQVTFVKAKMLSQ